jgi:1-acyl-sn-glycerol-3-phosphate acyltransferase
MDFWWESTKAIVGVYRLLFQRSANIHGKDNLPGGPKILVGNHANVTDAFVLPFLVKEKIHFFIQEEFFSIRLLGEWARRADQIPVSIGRGREALNTALGRLERGNSVMLFPEGKLNHGQSLRRAGAGAAILAAESGAPLVPLGFFVPDQFAHVLYSHHYGRLTVGRWQFGGSCYLQIGKPRRISTEILGENSYRQLREATDQIMKCIADLIEKAKVDAAKCHLTKS